MGVHTLNFLRRRYIGVLRLGSVRVELNVMRHDGAESKRRFTLAQV